MHMLLHFSAQLYQQPLLPEGYHSYCRETPFRQRQRDSYASLGHALSAPQVLRPGRLQSQKHWRPSAGLCWLGENHEVFLQAVQQRPQRRFLPGVSRNHRLSGQQENTTFISVGAVTARNQISYRRFYPSIRPKQFQMDKRTSHLELEGRIPKKPCPSHLLLRTNLTRKGKHRLKDQGSSTSKVTPDDPASLIIFTTMSDVHGSTDSSLTSTMPATGAVAAEDGADNLPVALGGDAAAAGAIEGEGSFVEGVEEGVPAALVAGGDAFEADDCGGDGVYEGVNRLLLAAGDNAGDGAVFVEDVFLADGGAVGAYEGRARFLPEAAEIDGARST